MMFVVLVVIIIFLMFQINDNANRHKATLVGQQEKVSQAARHLLQATTSNHPFFAIEHSMRAKILIDEIVHDNGGILAAERHLKLRKDWLRDLKNKVYQQHNEVETFVMDRIITQFPDLDVQTNELADLTTQAKPKGKRRRKSKR